MHKLPLTFRRKIVWGYMAAVISMLCIVVVVLVERNGFRVNYGLEEYSDISSAWTYENGETVDFTGLKGGTAGTAGLFFTVPQMDKNTSLVYRSQNVYTKVFLGGELIYETDMFGKGMPGNSPGSRWNIVTLLPEQAGQTLEMQVTEAYTGEGLTIDHVYWGDRAAIVLDAIREKLAAVLISIAICLSGLFIIILDIPLNYGKRKKNHGLRSLGFFSLFIGGWCLVETNILQLVVNDTQILQVISNMLLIISVLPIMLYADWTYGIFRYRLARIMSMLELLFLAICVVLPITGVADWHRLLPVARVLMAICAGGFVIWSVAENFSGVFSRKNTDAHQRSSRSLASHLQLIGIGALGITAVLELARFSAAEAVDKALVVRFGLLIFILCFAVSSQFSTYRLITRGMKYDSVHKLAYSDVLTKLGNRTAYLERLEECVSEHVPELGIVFFDVNNLKQVNDTYGHDMGDVMIKTASEVIGESFGIYGRVYRIGGDEFCALLECDVPEKYERATEAFREAVRAVNEKKEYLFTLQIAHGFASCEADSMDIVEETVKAADERMYRDKAKLKA